jgi:hypothetical protein
VSWLVTGLAVWVVVQWVFVVAHFVLWVRRHPVQTEAEQVE